MTERYTKTRCQNFVLQVATKSRCDSYSLNSQRQIMLA